MAKRIRKPRLRAPRKARKNARQHAADHWSMDDQKEMTDEDDFESYSNMEEEKLIEQMEARCSRRNR